MPEAPRTLRELPLREAAIALLVELDELERSGAPCIPSLGAVEELRRAALAGATPEVDFGTFEQVISGLDAINKHNSELAAATPASTPEGDLVIEAAKNLSAGLEFDGFMGHLTPALRIDWEKLRDALKVLAAQRDRQEEKQ